MSRDTSQPEEAPARPPRERRLSTLLDKARAFDLRLDLPATMEPPKAAAPPPRPSTGAPRSGARRRRPPGTFALWLLASPLLLSAVVSLAAGRFSGFLGDALGWGLVAFGATLIKRAGSVSVMPERRFSRGVALPRKNLGGLSVAAGVMLAAVFGVGHSLPVGLSFGVLTVLAFHLIYGFEPFVIGPKLSAPDRESRQVAEALAEAEGRLLTIERAARAVHNPELEARLQRIAQEGRAILAQIAERPSDLRRARRFLAVFLEGAERVSDGYVRTHRHGDSAELTQSFRNVLVTIEEQFRRQRERLRSADVLDLDVQIEVLKKQLEQEGIR
jgi:hypothetical protein